MNSFKIISFLIDRSLNHHSYDDMTCNLYHRLAYLYSKCVEDKGSKFFDRSYRELTLKLEHSHLDGEETLYLQKKLSEGLF